MSLATIDRQRCIHDGLCIKACPVHLFVDDPSGVPRFQNERAEACIGCGHCVAVCPADAVDHLAVPLAESPLLEPALTVSGAAATQLLKSRRSIRRFTAEPVAEEPLRRVLDTARWAPTASNRQQVHWLVIRELAAVRHLAGVTIDWLRGIANRPAYYEPFIAAWDRGEDWVLRGAPHLAVAHAPENDWGAIDCAIAVTYFELAALAEGFGTCWAGFLTRAAGSDAGVAAALALPAGHRMYGGVMFGNPEFRYRRSPQRRLAQVEWR